MGVNKLCAVKHTHTHAHAHIQALFTLRDDYYPGDIGFDPLGFKPDTPEAFVEEQNRESSFVCVCVGFREGESFVPNPGTLTPNPTHTASNCTQTHKHTTFLR